MARQTAAGLRRWKADQAVERLAFGAPWKSDGGLGVPGEWVATEPDGAVTHPDTLLGRWKRLAASAGVPAIPLHGARHSYAMLALGAGARLDVVSRQLGHASAAFTADIYAHHSDEAAAQAAELVAEALAVESRYPRLRLAPVAMRHFETSGVVRSGWPALRTPCFYRDAVGGFEAACRLG